MSSSSTYIDQSQFLSDKFDVHAYANAVLAGQIYRPDEEFEQNGTAIASGSGSSTTVGLGPGGKGVNGDVGGKGDIGSELAKLNHGIVSAAITLSIGERMGCT